MIQPICRARIAAAPSVATSKHPGNEKLLFHGTNRCCLLAEDSSNTALCHFPECHLCCVIRNSFDIRKCGSYPQCHIFGTLFIWIRRDETPISQVTAFSNWQPTELILKLRRFGTGIYTTSCSSSTHCSSSSFLLLTLSYQRQMITPSIRHKSPVAG